jgi:GTP-binding protein Era
LNPNEKCGYVALVGLPNAGKSTISNRLLGQRYSIVTKKPNTTRKRVLGIRSEKDCQLILLDTPGVVTKQSNLLDSSMMKAVTAAVSDADILLMIVDANYEPYETLKLLKPPEDQSHIPIAVVINKVDLVDEDTVAELQNWVSEQNFAQASIATCGKTGEGTEQLLHWCNSSVPQGPWLYPKEIISDHPERFFVAEIVREKLILQYEEEVPYASHVHVLDFKERKSGKDYISIEIAVERESQKKILIGKQGSALKKLATASRMDIEQFLMRPVYIDMHVKVHKDWRKSQDELSSLGLSEMTGSK